MTRLLLIAVSCAAMAVTTTASAGMLVFSDDFDNENGGIGALNFSSFNQWSVTNGTVDLIGNGFHDLQPGNGLYLDMDGSSGQAGTILSLDINLGAGDYQLRYDLAGNFRNAATEGVTASVETGLTSRSESLAISQPFMTFADNFTLGSMTTVQIQFLAIGGDNVGMLLDNIELEKLSATTVPEPTSLAIFGICGLGLLTRRRRMKNCD